MRPKHGPSAPYYPTVGELRPGQMFWWNARLWLRTDAVICGGKIAAGVSGLSTLTNGVHNNQRIEGLETEDVVLRQDD